MLIFIRQKMKKNSNKAATLIEVLWATGTVFIVLTGIFWILQFHRVRSQKAMEHAVMLDFAKHYIEIARQQNFFDIRPGEPINAMFNGSYGAPDIRFPANSNWQSLWTEDLRNFHPDLEWFGGQSPQYRCIITDQMVGMETRSKHIQFEVRWQPYRGKNTVLTWMNIRLDSIVYQDFN